MIAWITRNVISRDKNTMLHIYKVIIRPHLEYCVQIWSPEAKHGNWGLILEIESVQRRFTRLIDGIGLLPYSERLQRLGITTLAERRLRGDLIETFKILNGLTRINPNYFWEVRDARGGPRLIKERAENGRKQRQSFFSYRVIQKWNLLSADIKMARSLEIFKNKLDEKIMKENV